MKVQRKLGCILGLRWPSINQFYVGIQGEDSCLASPSPASSTFPLGLSQDLCGWSGCWRKQKVLI